MHAHSQRSDQQEFTVEHNRVGEVVLVLRHKDRVGCHTTYMPPTSLPIACTFLEVSFFFDAEGPCPSARTFSHSVTTRSSTVCPSFWQGESSICVLVLVSSFHLIFFWHTLVQTILGWARDFRSTKSGVLPEIVMLVFPLFARFLLFSAGICVATLCFSISSCRDDVARVAGLALQGRFKVVVRVCVVSFWCCFVSSVVSSLWLPLVK